MVNSLERTVGRGILETPEEGRKPVEVETAAEQPTIVPSEKTKRVGIVGCPYEQNVAIMLKEEQGRVHAMCLSANRALCEVGHEKGCEYVSGNWVPYIHGISQEE